MTKKSLVQSVVRLGNTLITNDRWNHLAIYHYSHAPSFTSPCTVCGLLPAANKALYVSESGDFQLVFQTFLHLQNACAILSPARHACRKSRHAPPELTEMEATAGTFMFEHEKASLNFTDKHMLRPDGFNSFEVICLSKTKSGIQSTSPIVASLRVGCLL